MKTKNILQLFIFALLALSITVPAFAGATIVIINLDGPGEGFNDLTPAVPVGGNPGTTRGAQRLIAFTYAADIWGATLDSNQTIFVNAAFNPLAPNVLGSAGATAVFRDFGAMPGFPGAEFPATWYSSALADKRAGFDFRGACVADLNAQFNSNFNFYLGLDANNGAAPDLVTVLLHELGHGLGFQNFVNEATGANLVGFTDVYSHYTLDITNGLHWSDMLTNAERAASAIRFGRVVWSGANVTDGVPNVLLFGSPTVSMTSPASIAGPYQFGAAAFGPSLTSVPAISAAVVRALDPSNAAGLSTTDGCSALTNAAAVSGKIAMIDRGNCTFVVKVKHAQNAGALAVIIANNVVGGAPGLGGADPTIVIPTVSLSLADANLIKAQFGVGVSGILGSDHSIRAGADALGRARLFMPNPVQGGSSGSHYDSIAFRNLLMEPAINNDLTHSLTEPQDLTLNLMRDIGWFPDADLDGAADSDDDCPNSINDATVVIGGCDSGVANVRVDLECTIADKVAACAANARNHGDFASCVTDLGNSLKKSGLISNQDHAAMQKCAARSN